MAAVLLSGERRLSCPNCTERVFEPAGSVPIGDGSTRMHSCRGLKGMIAPLVLGGLSCKVEAVERGDYVGREVIRRDGEGRPIMAVVTTRDDGRDSCVMAPVAHGRVWDG